MQKMDVETVESGAELIESVDPCLAPAPVVVVAPVLEYFADIGQRNALGPVVRRLPLRQSRVLQTNTQIFQVSLRNFDAEWFDIGHLESSQSDAQM